MTSSPAKWQALLMPLPDEQKSFVPQIKAYRAARSDLADKLETLAKNPATAADHIPEHLPEILNNLRAAARRLPLDRQEESRAAQLLEKMTAAEDDEAYALFLLAASLYKILPKLGALNPERLPVWIKPALEAAIQGHAIISATDDDAQSEATLAWVLNFAQAFRAAGESGKIKGGTQVWRDIWLPFFAFSVFTFDYYSTTSNLAPFVRFFGELRAEAFANAPLPCDGSALRLVGQYPARSPEDTRARIGVFCSHPTSHPHGLPHFITWMTQLDRRKFNPVLILQKTNEYGMLLEKMLAVYPALSDIAPIAVVPTSALAQVATLDLDVIYHMDDLCRGRPDRVGSMRLARHQITGFYTPATTGCAAMDAYITSPDLDPDPKDAFTEKMILSQGLPFCFHYESYFGVAPLLTRADLGLDPDAVILTMGASMSVKLRPAFVACVVRILAAVPNALCVCMPLTRPKDRVHMVDLFVRTCAEKNVDPNRILFYATPNRTLLYGLLSYSDVFLDFFPFSGTNNVIDPLAHETPLVVMAPEKGYSRNRIGGAILKAMNLDELVVQDEDSFVQTAIALAQSPEKRAEVRRRMGRVAIEQSPLCDSAAYIGRMEKVIEDLLAQDPTRPPLPRTTTPKPATLFMDKSWLDKTFADFSRLAWTDDRLMTQDDLVYDHLFKKFAPHISPDKRATSLSLGLQNTREVAFVTAMFAHATLLNPSGEVMRKMLETNTKGDFTLAIGVPDALETYGPQDAIFSIHTMNFYEDADSVLRAIEKSLKPKGRAFIAVQNAEDGTRRLALAMGQIPSLQDIPPMMKHYGQKRYLTLESLRAMIARAGLREIATGGAFLKVLTEAQTSAMQTQNLITPAYLKAHLPLGDANPELCATIYVVAEKE